MIKKVMYTSILLISFSSNLCAINNNFYLKEREGYSYYKDDKIVEKKVHGLFWWIGLINIIAVGGWLVYQLLTKTTALAVFKKLLKIN